MSDKHPIKAIFEALARAEERDKNAHAHADTFEQALRDEFANAKAAGACASCINRALLKVLAEGIVQNSGLDDPMNLSRILAGLRDILPIAVTAAAVDAMAAKKARANG